MASSADDVVLVDEDIQESGTSISLTSNQSPPKKHQCIPSASTASGFKSIFKRPPAKKKPKKYYNTFKKEWETDFHKDGILASKKGPDFAYCRRKMNMMCVSWVFLLDLIMCCVLKINKL